MSFARAATLAILLSLVLAIVAGCGGGGGSASGPGIAPGASSGSLALKVAFSDETPRLEVQGEKVLLVTSESTERLQIDLFDEAGEPVVGTTVVERTVGEPLQVTIHGIPFGRWKLRILAFSAGDIPVGQFAQEVLIERGRATTVSATVTPVVSPSPSPSGRTFAYVANQGSNSLSGYELLGGNALASIPGSPWSVSAFSPVDLALAPSRNFVFAALSGGASVSPAGFQSFGIVTDGALANVNSVSMPGVNQPFGVVAHPGAANRLYGALRGTGTLVAGSYDPATGALISMGGGTSEGASLGRLAIHPSGNHLYLADGPRVIAFDLDAGGNPSNARAVTLAGNINRLEIHPSGSYVFASTSSPNTVFSMSVQGDGSLSVLPGPNPALGIGDTPMGMAALGSYVLVACSGGGPGANYVGVLQLGPTGLTLVNSSPAGERPRDVDQASDGTLLVVSAAAVNANNGDLRRFVFSAPNLVEVGTPVATGADPQVVLSVHK